jgi:hypothetical protein
MVIRPKRREQILIWDNPVLGSASAVHGAPHEQVDPLP